VSLLAAVAGVLAVSVLWPSAGPGRAAGRLAAVRATRASGPPAPPRRPWGRTGRRRGEPDTIPVDLVLELVAGLLDAGAPVRQAVRLVETALAGGSVAGGSVTGASVAGVAEVIALSESSGLPAAALLRARADDLRREREAAHGRAVQRLGVHLVMPMGLCLLPAFVLLGIVPVVVDLLGGA
jgi:tight adherence protein B